MRVFERTAISFGHNTMRRNAAFITEWPSYANRFGCDLHATLIWRTRMIAQSGRNVPVMFSF